MEVKADRLTRFITRTPMIGDWLMLALFPRRHRTGTNAERALPGSVENIVERQQNELRFKGFIAAILASMRGILSTPQRDQHKTIHQAGIPVLAIWGREDAAIALTAMGTLAEWSRHARQDVIEGAGHGLPYTHTDAVLAALSEALRDGLS